MTKPQTVIGTCGKRIYPKKQVAKMLARRVNDSGKERVHPYHCTRCHGWHLGTPGGPNNERRPRTQEKA